MFEHADDKLVFVDGSLAPAVVRALATGDRKYRSSSWGHPRSISRASTTTTTRSWSGSPRRSPGRTSTSAAARSCLRVGHDGRSRGRLFTHRSSVLHALTSSLGDTLAIRQSDALMPVVPMFRVNAWGTPFSGRWWREAAGCQQIPAAAMNTCDRQHAAVSRQSRGGFWFGTGLTHSSRLSSEIFRSGG